MWETVDSRNVTECCIELNQFTETEVGIIKYTYNK